MSAQMETFLKIKKVIDHDCGNYKMGEIDFYPRHDVRQYVLKYGQFGVNELHRAFHALMEEAYESLRDKNQGEQVGVASAGG